MVDAGRVCRMTPRQDGRGKPNEGHRGAVETTSGRKRRLLMARKVAPDSRGRPPRRLLHFVSAVAHTKGSHARSNPRQASGHRRVPEVWQFVCQEGLHYGARRDVRRNEHRSSSSRSGAGSPGRTVAYPHPGAYTQAPRRHTLLGDKGPDLRRPGPQILHIFLRDLREVPRCVRPRTFRGGNRGLRTGYETLERQIRDYVLRVSSRRRERQQTVCRHGGTCQKKVRRDAMGAQGSTPGCRQGENQRRNTIRPGEPKAQKAYRQGRRCIQSFDESDARTGVTTSAQSRSPPNAAYRAA